MIVITEQLDFDNLSFDTVHHLAPKCPLGEFSWDTRLSRIPYPDYDLEAYKKAVAGFYQRLTLLRCGRDSRHSPTDAQVETFTRHLVENQRNNRNLRFGHGSWAIPEDTEMPSDAAVDFAFVPSYLAVAWLVLVKERYPHIAKNVMGMDKCLRLGLRFIFLKDLYGSGHDGNRELLKAVEYLSLGTVFSFIAKNADVYPQLVEKIRNIESRIMRHMPNVNGFSATHAYSRTKALHLIRGGDRDDSLVCPPIWLEWQLSQSAWAYNRILEIAPSIAADRIFPSVKEKTVESVQRIREAFHEVKPKYAVFGRPRNVTSNPIDLDLIVSLEPSIELAIEKIGIVPWANHLSTIGFMNAVKQSFISRLATTIDKRFRKATEFNNEEFTIHVANIKKHEIGYQVQLCARG